MRILKKLLIKDYKNVGNAKVRYRYGIVAGIIGLVGNIILFTAKIAVGIIGHSLSVIADAINNLSDAGNSAITVFGFKMAAKPADKEHPYGHERYEQITALIVAIMMFAIGLLLAKSSIEKIIDGGNYVVISIYTYIVLILAVLGKFLQMLVYKDFGKAICSEALTANADDSRNDIISTLAVLTATVIMQFVKTNISIDGIFGTAVSIFIVISGIALIKKTISPLLGEKPDKELVDKISQKLLGYDGVLGIHDLMIHNYGANNTYVLVHIEVDANVNVMKSHELIDNIEQDFAKETGMHLSVHMDPVEIDNEEVNHLKKECLKVLKQYDERLSMHDFRIVSGKGHTNILFDVVIPYECKICKDDLIKIYSDKIKDDIKTYYFIIDIDRPYM